MLICVFVCYVTRIKITRNKWSFAAVWGETHPEVVGHNAQGVRYAQVEIIIGECILACYYCFRWFGNPTEESMVTIS